MPVRVVMATVDLGKRKTEPRIPAKMMGFGAGGYAYSADRRSCVCVFDVKNKHLAAFDAIVTESKFKPVEEGRVSDSTYPAYKGALEGIKNPVLGSLPMVP